MDTNLYSTELVVTRPEDAPKEKQISWPHMWTDFKKGDRKKNGEKFPTVAVEKTEEGLQKFIQFYGWENTYDTIIAAYNIFSQSAMDTALEELSKPESPVKPGTIEFNKAFVERYTRFMTDLETRGETKDELNESIKKASTELSVLSEQQVKAGELLATTTEGGPEWIKASLELLRVSKEVNKLIGSIKKAQLALAVKARKRKKNAGEDDDESVPAGSVPQTA